MKLIELLIVLAVVVLIAVVFFQTGAPHDRAVESARGWAADLGIRADGVSCAKYDSDGDGYVSCTVRSGEDLHMVECGWLVQSGCRKPKFQTGSK